MIQQLNKFASVEIETRPLSALSDSYFTDFTAILVSNCADVSDC